MNCKFLKTTTILCSLLPGVLLADSFKTTTREGGTITSDGGNTAQLNTSNGGKVSVYDEGNTINYSAEGVLGAEADKQFYEEDGSSVSLASGNRGGTASNTTDGEGNSYSNFETGKGGTANKTTWSDGSSQTTINTANGNQVNITTENGNTTAYSSKGGTFSSSTNSLGTTETNIQSANGATVTKTTQKDGSSSGSITKNGTTISRSTQNGNGIVTITKPEGTTRTTTKTITKSQNKDGTTTITGSNGSIKVDGSEVTFSNTDNTKSKTITKTKKPQKQKK